MALTIHRTDERILIKYIDDTFNIFSCIIPYHDKFVIDYCNSKLEKLEKLLKNHILEEHDNKIILKVEEPICINYTLNKQPTATGEQSGLILSKVKQLEKENKILKEKLEDSELVYLDKYMVPINKGITTLYLHTNLFENSTPVISLDLTPLEVCKKLTKINILLHSLQILDLTPLKNLVELTILNNQTSIRSILGLDNCKKLSYLKLTYCNDIDMHQAIFQNCTNLKELYITHSPYDIDFNKLQYTLERLTIENCKIYSINIVNCKLLQYLKIIFIEERNRMTCKLDNLTKLEEIILQGNIAITGLQKCINLKKISFSNYSNQNINLEDKNMADFKYLETIDLTGATEIIKGISNIRSGVQKIGF
jgi:hypothetical protein